MTQVSVSQQRQHLHAYLKRVQEGEAIEISSRGRVTLGRSMGEPAIADVSLWELALLQERGRLVLPEEISAGLYLKQLLAALRLQVLPITPEIALLSRSPLFQHDDPADRLIGATALQVGVPRITADARLRAMPELNCLW